MPDRKAQIALNLDDYRMLKMLSAESGESIEIIIHQLLRIIWERIEHAYENNEVPEGMDGYSLNIFKALHLKRVGSLTGQEFDKIIGNPDLHYLIDKLLDAESKNERRDIMNVSQPLLDLI